MDIEAEPVLRSEGICPCCQEHADFVAHDEWLRSAFRCSECNSAPRERALMATLEMVVPGWAQLAIHESSPGPQGASLRLARECAAYETSQYFPEHRLGEQVGKHRNENLERQTWEDGRFDVVVTQDVMEHVFDPDAAFREIARTLKPGGVHVFTTPLVNQSRPSEVAARLGYDGVIEYVREPEYHGNPIDPNGSLVTMRWGYDIGEHIQRASGMLSTLIIIDDLSRGIRAQLNEVVVSRKQARFDGA